MAPAPAGTGLISGVVLVGADPDHPARRARVLLRSADGSVEGRSATTDDMGRFTFEELPAGRFTLEAVKAGYLNVSFGGRAPGRAGVAVALAEGGRIGDVRIQLARGAVLSGTVRDPAGRAVPDVSVTAVRHGWTFAGERRLVSAGAAETNDLGEFRIWGLQAGDYYVMATRRPGPTMAFEQLSAAEVDRALTESPAVATPRTPMNPGAQTSARAQYLPVFFPSVLQLPQASAIGLELGEERGGIDLTLQLGSASNIRGTVHFADGQPAASADVRLLSDHSSMNGMAPGWLWRAPAARTGEAGVFDFHDIAPGRYRILATTAASGSARATPRPALWAETMVDVALPAVDIAMTLRPAMKITGRVALDSRAAAPGDLSGLAIYFTPAGRAEGLEGPHASVVADGTFAIDGVVPDSYAMVLVGERPWPGEEWQLESVVANGRDITDGRLIVAPGENVDLTITFTDRVGGITGAFQEASGHPATDYFIVLFATDERLWGSPRRRYLVRPDSAGHYVQRFVPPGEYLLAALTDVRSDDLHDPAFLRALVPGALRVTIRKGEIARQDLRVGR